MKLVSAQPMPFVAVTRRTRMADIPRELIAGLDIVWAAVRRNGVEGLGHNVAVYRHVDRDSVEMTCGVQVAWRFDDIEDVFRAETPGGEAMTATHVGPYDRLGETYDEIARAAAEAGRRLAGVNWEIYGDWGPDPRKVETEVYMLLAPVERERS
jgi:effector-binding domain-containing protein